MDYAIRVTHVSKSFRLPHEKAGSIKNIFVNAARYIRHQRSYEIQHALKDINFDVGVGEFLGIVGRNGSGKSTLLKLLAQIYTPDKGSIHVNGKLTPFIELGVGFNPELTGRENVFLNGALLGFSRKEMAAMYDDIVAFAELERFMDQKLKNYSSGMQVRLAFSIAVRVKTDILLLDEVLAVGDAAFQQKCYNYFEDLKERKVTVVFVSHDMSAVRRFCSRAIYIKDSQIVKDGSPSDIADLYTIENLDPSQVNQTTRNPNYQLHARVASRSDEQVTLEFQFKSLTNAKLFIGISLQRDGVSVAEITTDQRSEKALSGSGKVTYTLDLDLLNQGAYQIGSGLFATHNRELVAVGENCTLVVRGADETRGASLRLKNTWRTIHNEQEG